MPIRRTLCAAAAAIVPLSAFAQADGAAALRQELQQLREQYEARLKALEARIEAAEKAQGGAPPAAAAPAGAPTPPPSLPIAAPTPSSAPILALSAILTGTYAHLRNDPARYRIQGFIPAGDAVGPGRRSFSLGESELTLSANVDPYFSGRLTYALTPDDGAEVEEAFVRTTSLPQGLSLSGGRFLSSIGYLNAQHAHAWDFVDAPLVHQALFGGGHRTDGVRLKWVAPTDTLLELTLEAGNGDAFPGSPRHRNGVGSVLLGARTGGDVGEHASWGAGASVLRASAEERRYADVDGRGVAVVDAFGGHSRTIALDGVYKWSPGRGTALKLQGELMWRRERGTLAYDVEGTSLGRASGTYRARPSGGYLQAVYQFTPTWRVGLRFDALRSGAPSIGLVDAGARAPGDFPLLAPFHPRRVSAMVDYSPTEFSRLRLQLASDRAGPGLADRQLFLQYIMSLGAHGAHTY